MLAWKNTTAVFQLRWRAEHRPCIEQKKHTQTLGRAMASALYVYSRTKETVQYQNWNIFGSSSDNSDKFMTFSGNSPTTVPTISNKFHFNFCKWQRSLHNLCAFKFSIATRTKYHNQTVFVFRGFPSTLKQQKNMVFPPFALSVTCTNTLRISAGDCLQDAGMLEPGILHMRVAAHFGFRRDSALNLWKHYHVSFISCDCLHSYHQHVMSKGYGVYTRVTRLRNRFQIACAISWSIPGLCAIKAKTCHNHLRGSHHLPLPTLCVGLFPMVQGNYNRAQLTGFDVIPDKMKNSQVSTSPTHFL